jgi:hypothetical protein
MRCNLKTGESGKKVGGKERRRIRRNWPHVVLAVLDSGSVLSADKSKSRAFMQPSGASEALLQRSHLKKPMTATALLPI